MAVLGIETSSALSVAVVNEVGTLMATHDIGATREHAELLTPAIERVLGLAEIDRSELTGVAVGVGPGPFTGLRVGITTARALGMALDIPVWGVPSHDALASQASAYFLKQRWQQGSSAPKVEAWNILVLTDARRRELYWSLYHVPRRMVGTGKLGGPGVVKPAHLRDVLPVYDPEEVIVVGAGAQLYARELVDAGFTSAERWLHDQMPVKLRYPSAYAVVRHAQVRAYVGLGQPTRPLYLRRPDVNPSGPQLPAPLAEDLLVGQSTLVL